MSVVATETVAAVVTTRIPEWESENLSLAEPSGSQSRRQRLDPQKALLELHGAAAVVPDQEGLSGVFSSVTGALSAAIAIQRRDAANSGLRPARIGVDCGELTASDTGWFGRSLETARWLSESARPAQILASELAIASLGGQLKIEYKPDRSGAVSVQWEAKPLADQLSLPPTVATMERFPFIGREPQLAELRAMLLSAGSGDTQFCSISAGAGFGKSRLIREFARFAHKERVTVLYGTAQADPTEPYSPLVQCLRHWAQEADNHRLDLEPSGGRLIALLASERGFEGPELIRSGSASLDQRDLYQAISDWLARLAREPLLLILDALEQDQGSTFELLNATLRALRRNRLMIVVAHRPEDQRWQELERSAAELYGPGHTRRLTLPPFTAKEIAELVPDGVADVEGLARAVHLVTGGLPLQVTQELSGPTPLEAGSLPATVDAALERKLADLSDSARRVMQLAAVLGESFELKDLLELLGEHGAGVSAALEQAEGHNVFELVDEQQLRYRFSHTRLREVAYRSVSAARLALLHADAGLQLEARLGSESDARVFDLARHFSRARALGYEDRAVRYLQIAAQRALDHYADADAERLFLEAIDVLNGGDVHRRCELAIGLGLAQKRQGNAEHRGVLLACADDALGLGDVELAGRALLAMYRGTYFRATHVEEALVARLREVLSRLGEPRSELRVRLMSYLSLELTWLRGSDEALRMGAEAIELARSLRDRTVLIEALSNYMWVKFDPVRERVQLRDELAQLVAEHPNPEVRFDVASHDVFTQQWVGNRQAMDQALGRARQLALEIDRPSVQSMLLLREASVAMIDADFESAEALIENRRSIARGAGEPDGEDAYRTQRFWLSLETEAPEQLRDRLLPLAQDPGRLPPHALAPLAFQLAELGAVDAVRRLAQTFDPLAIGALVRDQSWLWNLCLFAECAVAMRDEQLARALLPLLEAHQGEHANIVFVSFGSVARFLARLHMLLGNLSVARVQLEAATAANARMGLRSWSARLALDAVELALEAGDRHAAQSRLATLPGAEDALRFSPALLERLSLLRESYASRSSK